MPPNGPRSRARRRMERKDPAQGAVLRAWLEAVLHEVEKRVLPFTGLTGFVAPACTCPTRARCAIR